MEKDTQDNFTADARQGTGRVLALGFTKESLERMRALAEIMDLRGPGKFAQLIQDSLSLTVWLLSNQRFGRRICALTEIQLAAVTSSPSAADNRIPVLARLYLDDKAANIQKFLGRINKRTRN